jgi:glutathione S-transferase
MLPLLPSLVTALALLLYLILTVNVARTRGRLGIEPPATSGDPAFERIYRVQQNTLEQLVVVVPALWLYALFVSPTWASAIGGAWLLGRILYAWGYYTEAKRRVPGMVITMLANLALVVGALIGILRALA